MTTRNWFSVSNRAGETEVFLFDEIGAHGITAKAFVAALKPHAGKPIRLRVNSPGGSVFDAVAIFNALKNHPRKVTASVEGIAASAASVIVMAAAEIRAASNSFLMIHFARTLPRRRCGYAPHGRLARPGEGPVDRRLPPLRQE